MKINKKTIGILLVILFASLLAACGSAASSDTDESSNEGSDYPNDTINLVVPFSAGGSGDVMVREIAKIAEDYGFFNDQDIVVENLPGGSGSIALNDVLNKEADGYTILNHSSTLPLTMSTGELPFTPDDIKPLTAMVSNYQVLAVPSDSPFETFEDFVDYAKENPGDLDSVSSQTNGANHMLALKIMEGAEVDFNYVAYDGGSEALTRILGGNGDAIISSGEVVQQQVEAGEIRILGVSSAERVPLHPDVPTFKEMGYERIDDELIWRGFFVKPETPDYAIEKIVEVFEQVSETEEFKEYAERTSQDVYFVPGEEFEEMFNRSYEDGTELFE